MQVHKPELNPMARDALVIIQASGVEITPEIVLWVQDAAKRVANGPLRSSADLLDWPIMAGGALLYPLTFGAMAWLQELPPQLRYDVRVIAFACAHAKQPQVFQMLRGNVCKMAAKVIWWACRLTCSKIALQAAVNQVLGSNRIVDIEDPQPPDDPDPDEHPWQWGTTVTALCAKYPGTAPAFWVWEVSREQASALLHGINAKLQESDQVTSYEIEATREFWAIVEHIKKTGVRHG